MHRLSISFLLLVALAGSAGAQPAPDSQPPVPPADQPPAGQPPADQPPAQPEPPNAPTGSPGGPPAPVTVTPPPSGSQTENKAEAPPSISGKWTTAFYGFAEGDLIYDTVQGATNGGG